MRRAWGFLVQSVQRRDLLGLVVLGLLVSVSLAATSILFSMTMRRAALKRFHLASEHYWQWAVHQTVPSMYNFENRVKFSNVIQQSGEFDTAEPSYVESAANHFPARFITFGDQRHVFADGKEGMLEMESVFGDTAFVSRWEIRRDQPNQLTVHRVHERFEQRVRQNAAGNDGGSRDE